MNRVILAVLLSTVAAFPAPRATQEKTKSEESEKKSESRKEVTPLRVQVIFNEYDGEKKISSLPYTLLVNADEPGNPAMVRMGLRVPIQTGTQGPTASQIQYMDVGTNLDGRAEKMADSRFSLRLSVERSSLYWSGNEQKPGSPLGIEASTARPSSQPVVQQFRSNINLLIRDGQKIQSTVATDPISGHVLKIDVTMNLIK